MSLRPRMQQKDKWHANCMANHYPILARPQQWLPNSHAAAKHEHHKVNFQGVFDSTVCLQCTTTSSCYSIIVSLLCRLWGATVESLEEATKAAHSVSQPVNPCCVVPTSNTPNVTVCRYRTGLMLLIPSSPAQESRGSGPWPRQEAEAGRNGTQFILEDISKKVMQE